VLYLDSSNRVKEREVLFEGTIDQAAVYPREVAAAALRKGAGRLVLVHNHPGGSLRPSRDDLALTEKLTAACRLLDIEVLDHLIVTECGYYSMKEHGEIGR
ncbi:MAG TPA: JAB domain-containing protein, partial [bacterium]|nr:JAB domain-containing protein [bacterium]